MRIFKNNFYWSKHFIKPNSSGEAGDAAFADNDKRKAAASAAFDALRAIGTKDIEGFSRAISQLVSLGAHETAKNCLSEWNQKHNDNQLPLSMFFY